MKYLKLYESFENIHEICRKHEITCYTINPDGSIDLNSGLDLWSVGISKIPLKFHRVNGNFYCSNNRLTS